MGVSSRNFSRGVPRDRGEMLVPYNFWKAWPINFGRAKKSPDFGTIFDNFRVDFDREYLRNGSTYIDNRKKYSINYVPFHVGRKKWWILVHKQKSSRGAYWPTHVDFFRETTFRPLGCCSFFTRVREWHRLPSPHPTGDGGPSKKFTRARDWQRLVRAHPNGVGGPPPKKKQKFNCKNLKFALKFSVCTPYNFGASGSILTKLFQTTCREAGWQCGYNFWQARPLILGGKITSKNRRNFW